MNKLTSRLDDYMLFIPFAIFKDELTNKTKEEAEEIVLSRIKELTKTAMTQWTKIYDSKPINK